MIELRLRSQRIEGSPLAWDDRTVHLLGRDGRLWEFHPDEATDFRKSSGRFRSYGVSELRAVLLRELGRGYEVSGTSHYLVAHPRALFDRDFERAVVDPANPEILGAHLPCAAAEIPLRSSEPWLAEPAVETSLRALEDAGELLQSERGSEPALPSHRPRD